MPIGPIDTSPLFGPLHAELIALLRSLTPAEWLRPTVAGAWRVRDVAAHLLDTALRRVAAQRDGHHVPLEAPIASAADVSRLVNTLNAGGVEYARRLSPRQLVDLIDISGEWVTALMTALPPRDRALWPVSWAGEAESENWMDVGREYTERWHHQMQIRDAVGRPLLLEPRWTDALLDICVNVLPVAYAGLASATGTLVRIEVGDATTRAWDLARIDGRWVVSRAMGGTADCAIRLSTDTAWRLFFNALSEERARVLMGVRGDPALAEPFVRARSVVL